MGIFGLPLLMNYYTVFDHANLKFGFVPLVNCYETKPPLVAGKTPLKSPPDQVAGELASRLIRGNRIGARDYLAQQSGLSPRDADAKISQLLTTTEQTLKNVGGTAAKAISVAGWTLFAGLALGTLFAFLGGGAGVNSELKSTHPPYKPQSRKKAA